LNGGNGLADRQVAGSFEKGWDSAWNSYIPTGPAAVDTWNTNLGCRGAGGTWTSTPQGNESLPIGCITWYEAYAFCIWDGGFLPSEAEWEYAEVGGSKQLEYPWGDNPPGTDTKLAIYNCYYPADGGACSVAPVGTALGVGRFTQLDLAGNAMEWTFDGYRYGVYPNPCVDCAYCSAPPDNYRTLRGGSADEPSLNLRPTFRYGYNPVTRGMDLGARCARTP
jgi:formylglycine-generating enzyme required for sulfatase activity